MLIKLVFRTKYVCGTGAQISDPTPPSKIYWLRPSKITWAPDSTALLPACVQGKAEVGQIWQNCNTLFLDFDSHLPVNEPYVSVMLD